MTEDRFFRLAEWVDRALMLVVACGAVVLGVEVGSSWPWWAITLVLPVGVLLCPLAGIVGQAVSAAVCGALQVVCGVRLGEARDPDSPA